MALYVGHYNLCRIHETVRMTPAMAIGVSTRRFTRLTNAFSKKLRNHEAAVGLYVGHYNFCRIHETLRTTPAMASGVVGEAADLLLARLKAWASPTMPPSYAWGWPCTMPARWSHPGELDGGGNAHEPDGERLLLDHGVDPPSTVRKGDLSLRVLWELGRQARSPWRCAVNGLV